MTKLSAHKSLHTMCVPGGKTRDGMALDDHSINNVNADIDIVFRNYVERLTDLIHSSNAVIGCVAWLSNVKILQALAECSFVQIVVQKEDFLRPEAEPNPRDYCKRLYNALKCNLSSQTLGLPSQHIDYIGGMYGHDFTEAVRCVGNYVKGPIKSALMHNKFLVLGNIVDYQGAEMFRPHAVWTGSANFSSSVGSNFENCIIIRNQQVAQQYLREWGQIYSISEPLDWDTEWSSPQFFEANT